MTRIEFMSQLSALLDDLSDNEREEALEYYENYFADAGIENEQEVIDTLKSPEDVAKSIKDGLLDATEGVITENGYSNEEPKNDAELMNIDNAKAYDDFKEEPQTENKPKLSTGMIVLIVILCILASPAIFGVLGAALGIILGIIGTLIGLICGLGGAGIGLIAAAIGTFVYGLVRIFISPLAGTCAVGVSLVLLAVGLVLLWLTVMICGKLLPFVIKEMVLLFKKIFKKGGRR